MTGTKRVVSEFIKIIYFHVIEEYKFMFSSKAALKPSVVDYTHKHYRLANDYTR